MLTPYLEKIFQKSSFTRQEAENIMNHVLEGADSSQIASLLSLLKYREETPEEIAGMVQAVKKKSQPITFPKPTLDIVGTGGDMAHTVNISTGAAILAAACGIPIAKHGNRSVSSKSGSADVLEALGVEIELSPEHLSICLEETNMAFMYAPYYHPSLKKMTSIRKSLKVPTVFNLLGPLLNPAQAEFALIGVAKKSSLELITQAILKIGTIKRALVFHGSGLDELTPIGTVAAYLIDSNSATPMEIHPADLGFTPCTLQDLQGGDAITNASILKDVFAGKPSAVADALIFTAGAALWIFHQAATLQEGVTIAKETLQSKKASHLLDQLIHTSQRLKNTKDYLAEIIADKTLEVDLLLQAIQENPSHPVNKVLKRNHISQHRFSKALSKGGLSVIAEIKRQSPSCGEICNLLDPVNLVKKYAEGGAAAISVLTDTKGFHGSLDDLIYVAQSTHLPILRKDFIIHPVQIAESAAAGASAVLLIAHLLKNDLKTFIHEAERLGLEALVEIHHLADLHLALEAGAKMIGVNHRNLKSFEVDLTISHHLRPLIPPHVITVAESGISTPSQAHIMNDLGYDAILVGEALVRAQDPIILLKQLRGDYES